MPFCLESALGEFACKIKEQITLEVQIGDKRRKKAPSLGTGIHLELGAVKLITSGGGEGEGGWKNNFCDFFFLGQSLAKFFEFSRSLTPAAD